MRRPFPAGLAISRDGKIYIADRFYDRIAVLSPGGHLLRSIGERGEGPGQFDEPTDVALDAYSNIYVADAKNDRIQKVSPAGHPIAVWGSPGSGLGQFARPDSIALDARGNIYVSDYYNDRVQKLSPAARRYGPQPGSILYDGRRDVSVRSADRRMRWSSPIVTPRGQALAVH